MTNRPTLFAPTEQPEPLEGVAMALIRCPFCEHSGPADAKFCSECGGALHLAPCPGCGAVNDVMAATCYQCRRPLLGRGAQPPAPLPVTVAASVAPRGRAWVAVAATASLATVIVGYYAYRQIPLERAAKPVAAPVATNPSAEPPAKTVQPDRLPPPPAPEPPKTVSLPSGAARVAPAVGAREGARPRPAEPAPGIKPAGAPNPRRRQTTAVAGQGACGAGVVALDLCGPDPAKLAPAETAAAEQPPPGNAPARLQEACTDALAALGLCPADTNLGRQ